MVTMDADHMVGALFGAPGQALWVQQLGAAGDDLGHAIASDGAGNLVVVGEFRGVVTVGGTTLTSGGGADIFVAKLAADTGVVAWAKSFGGTSDDIGVAVACDSAGKVYLTGTFQDSVNFGSGAVASAGGTDGFAMKLDTDGGYVWSKTIGGTLFDSAKGIAVHGTSVVVVGNYQGSMTVNGVAKTSAGAEDAFLVQYMTDGTDGWVETFGGAGNDDARSVAIDGAGDVVTVGLFSGTTNFGGGSVASAGQDDAFLAKFSGTNGAYLFAKPLGGIDGDIANAVSLDAADNIFVVGLFGGDVDFGNGAPLNGNANNMFVAKYSLAGSYQWAKAFGDTTTVIGNATSVNASGDVAIAGSFCGTVSFGGAPLTSVKTCAQFDNDIFAVRLSGADGSHINSVREGGTGLDVGNGVSETADGRYYITGGFQGFAEFGGQGLTSAGGYDAIVLGLAPL